MLWINNNGTFSEFGCALVWKGGHSINKFQCVGSVMSPLQYRKKPSGGVACFLGERGLKSGQFHWAISLTGKASLIPYLKPHHPSVSLYGVWWIWMQCRRKAHKQINGTHLHSEQHVVCLFAEPDLQPHYCSLGLSRLELRHIYLSILEQPWNSWVMALVKIRWCSSALKSHGQGSSNKWYHIL